MRAEPLRRSIGPGYHDAMNEAMLIFDRALVRRHRERAAAPPGAAPAGAAFTGTASAGVRHGLQDEVAERLTERLDDVRRRFAVALALGTRRALIARRLEARGGTETVIEADMAVGLGGLRPGLNLVCDEEALPFAERSFDLVLSCLDLHWVNDLPGALIQSRRALKPDGLFLGALFGGETLHELRAAFLEAESEHEGGAGLHVSPCVDVRDAGGLLQRAGFALPVVDADRIVLRYADPLSLMADLRAMGEANALRERRRRFLRRSTLGAVCATYRHRFGAKDGTVPATFEVLYLTGWSPHESQQKPLAPGSGQTSLAKVLRGE
jgi:SAM-dependent methyltransferase